ncbi:hypothetical protein EMIHUDRAFT_117345 [Emiliania huxleyi CCMP1516]|uniref:Cupin-like domain-containing protein n=2 Tax=Emiliania huxleyi TaxID=2903 RepID=A0A0D3JCC2_EMIH1|nr:hypothetical protein EMIHUDRAFT_117345 [Emiliania huxleyi CCMP1516]EOD21157.1 hypothetical protein EMIHUDRAFT_117345 [Emiliania huxleyi CCMP1516]|eukprot:XP_005773586.1 hypothetical protein EMIHUDRAFT_117345 [Emiliania huxleyi CCMP1516]
MQVAPLLSSPAVPTFSKFREPPAALSEEWRSWSTANSVSPAELSNAAIRHALAVTRFCSARSLGCTWAEHHALLDMSRAPYAHLYDQHTVPSEARPDATSCARLHRPNASQLLALVRDSQPAVLTGLLDGWPATRKWTDEYLAAALGERRVALSRIQYLGTFDEPEPIERWTGTSSGGGGGASGEWVIARPAHETMKFRDALRAIASAGESGLSRYLEYFPLEAFRSPSLLADLAPPAAAAATAAADETEARSWARTGGGAGSSFGDGDASAAPPLRGRGNEEAGSLPLASWLLPRKQLLWLGPENTVTDHTHKEPCTKIARAGTCSFLPTSQ